MIMPLVDIGDLRLNVTGESRRTLVLIHGNLASADWFDLCLPRLSPSFRVVCIEWRGCGLSDKPPPSPDYADYSPRQHAEDILKVLQALGIGNCDLVGHSTGALIGNYLVCDDPQRFRRIVCLDPVPPQSLPFDDKAKQRFARAQQDPAYARWFLATAVSSLFEPASLRYDPDSPDPPDDPVFRPTASTEQRVLFDLVVCKAGEASPGIWLGTPVTLDRLRTNNDLVPRMAGVRHPHLIIRGEKSFIPLEEVTEMTKIIPDTELRILDGIGHSANIEAPDQFCDRVLDFLLA
jgi:non-heme chloroperoxidase